MRVGLVTLGCDKNTVDNEYLAGLLEDAGCEVVVLDDPEAADGLDAAVVLTCGFIGDAKAQSVAAIVKLAEGKRARGVPARLFVAGCLAQRYAADLLKEIPEIDGIAGVGQFDQLAKMVVGRRGGEKGGKDEGRRNAVKAVPCVDIRRFMRRRRLDKLPYAFLKIADGCNHACSFCSIPSMKGRLRSVSPEILLKEAKDLVRQGVRELNLVAQDVSVYGTDLGRDYRLPALLRALCAIEGDFWVRCLYCYPGGVSDELIETIATEAKIVPYLDIPLQHLDRTMLERMKRPCADLDATDLVERLRRSIPDLTLRTTMLVGFPGETPAAHRRMLEGMRTLRFDRLGAFEYSREEGTSAAQAPRQVGKVTREKRWHAVMALQAEIAARLNAARIGRRERVLVEGYDADRRQWIARSAADAPEVDGHVYVESGDPVGVGEFVTVEITDADVYDVTAVSTRNL